MMCLNTDSPEYKRLIENTDLHPFEVFVKVNMWFKNNPDATNYPTLKELGIKPKTPVTTSKNLFNETLRLLNEDEHIDGYTDKIVTYNGINFSIEQFFISNYGATMNSKGNVTINPKKYFSNRTRKLNQIKKELNISNDSVIFSLFYNYVNNATNPINKAGDTQGFIEYASMQQEPIQPQQPLQVNPKAQNLSDTFINNLKLSGYNKYRKLTTYNLNSEAQKQGVELGKPIAGRPIPSKLFSTIQDAFKYILSSSLPNRLDKLSLLELRKDYLRKPLNEEDKQLALNAIDYLIELLNQITPSQQVKPRVEEAPVNEPGKFKYKNKTIDTAFTLTRGQEKALERLVDFSESTLEESITLQGAAGTGKTAVIGYLQKYLGSKYNFVYMAPTHAATAELAFATVPIGNLELPLTVASSFSEKRTVSGEKKILPSQKLSDHLALENNIIVIDESSMLTGKDYESILQVARDAGFKIIFMGDMKQIPEVDSRNPEKKQVSSAFTVQEQVILSEVKRTKSNSILTVLTELRNTMDGKIPVVNNSDQLKYLSQKEYNKELVETVTQDPENTIVIAYTNRSVAANNKAIRKVLGREGNLQKGDIVVGYLGYSTKDLKKGHIANSIRFTVNNVTKIGSAYRITASSQKMTDLKNMGLSVPSEYKGNYLQLSKEDSFLFDDITDNDMETNKKDIKYQLSYLHDLKQHAIKSKSGQDWAMFYKKQKETGDYLAKNILGNNYIYNPETENVELYDAKKHSSLKSKSPELYIEKGIDFGHAITVHKSQGASIKNVFFDTTSLPKENGSKLYQGNNLVGNEKHSLIYVGMSRASNKLIINNTDSSNFKRIVNPSEPSSQQQQQQPIREDFDNETLYQNNTSQSTNDYVASEKTIRDLAAKISDRIGIPVQIENDVNKQYKGKLENGIAYVNLAYATLDTPIHEILGHPIVRAIKKSKPGLYKSLLKELETVRGKEVLDRIKKDYEYKKIGIQNELIVKKEIRLSNNVEKDFYKIVDKNNQFLYIPDLPFEFYNSEKEAYDVIKTLSTKIPYTLEEQQEEAIVELLGLMTADRLDKVKDGKLISLLKRLLKEIKDFMKQLLSQKEVEIDKLPDNMTLGDIADLLAYSNSKLILPGNEVVYTTPDNRQFKTYAEASKHIGDLAKIAEEVELSDINYSEFTDQDQLELDNLKGMLTNGKLTTEQFQRIDYLREKKLAGFISSNKEYKESKRVVEEWKKVNDIKYNPEEVYSRGEGFYSILGAYSNLDVELLLQNLLAHIEDHEKSNGEFTISATTDIPDHSKSNNVLVKKNYGHNIYYEIFPQSEDILWAAIEDVASGSVMDASERMGSVLRSEIAGVSYTKYPNLNSLNYLRPSLAEALDDTNKNRTYYNYNELGINLTGNNFRLSYDKDVPYSTKKIIDSINSILDQKYGKINKPKIKKRGEKIGFQPTQTNKNLKQSIDKVKYSLEVLSPNQMRFEENLYELETELHNFRHSSINENKFSNEDIYKDYDKVAEGDTSLYYEKDGEYFEIDLTIRSAEPEPIDKESFEEALSYYGDAKKVGERTFYTIKIAGESLSLYLSNQYDTREEAEKNIKDNIKRIESEIESLIKNQRKESEYDQKVLKNKMVLALKGTARKFPRSLIASKVRNIMPETQFGDDLPFQRISSQQVKPGVEEVPDWFVIDESEITYTDDDGNLCAANGLSNTVSGTKWKIVKDFKGKPKHSQGGYDITIKDNGFYIGNIKAKNGLVLPAKEPTQHLSNPNPDGSLPSYFKGSKANPIQLDEVTVTAEAPEWLKHRREYVKNNPFSIDKYVENRFNNPVGREAIEKIDAEGWKKTLRRQGLEKRYNSAMDYVAEQLVKNKPQGKLSRAEWLNTMSDKEEELIKRIPRYQSSLWADTRRGLTSLVEQNPLQTFQNILNSSDYSNREKQEMLQDYIDHPIMSKLGDAAKILNPLTVPSKIVQSSYKDDYSFTDALKGKKNNAGIVEDIITDPLNLVGAGLVGKLSKADKVIDATKAGSKVSNKTDDVIFTERKNMEIMKKGNQYFKELDNPESLKRLKEFGDEYGIDLIAAYKKAEERWDYGTNIGKNERFQVAGEEVFKDDIVDAMGVSKIKKEDLVQKFLYKDKTIKEDLSEGSINYINEKASIEDYNTIVWHELSHDINKNIIGSSQKLQDDISNIFVKNLEEVDKTKALKAKEVSNRLYKSDFKRSDKNIEDTIKDELDYISKPTETWAFLSTNLRQDLKNTGIIKDYNELLTPEKLEQAIKNGNTVFSRFEPYIKDKDAFIKLFNKMTLSIAPAVLYLQSQQNNKTEE